MGQGRDPFAAIHLLVLAFVLWQCQATRSQIGYTPPPISPPAAPTATVSPPTPTPVPLPTSTPAPVSGFFALQDDFSANRNQWTEQGPDELGNAIFLGDGAYHLRSVFAEDGDNFQWCVNKVWFFTNFQLKVEATQMAGTDDNQIAVIFRAADRNSLYLFAYSGDGFFMLGQYSDGIFDYLHPWDTSITSPLEQRPMRCISWLKMEPLLLLSMESGY